MSTLLTPFKVPGLPPSLIPVQIFMLASESLELTLNTELYSCLPLRAQNTFEASFYLVIFKSLLISAICAPEHVDGL